MDKVSTSLVENSALRLRMYREKLALSQGQMADLLGITQSGYSLKELAQNKVTYKQAKILAAKSGYPVPYWLGEDVVVNDADDVTIVAEDAVVPVLSATQETSFPVKIYEAANPRQAMNERFTKAVEQYVFTNKTSKRQLAKDWGINYSMLAEVCTGARDVSITFLIEASRKGLFNMNYIFLEYGDMYLPIKRAENLSPVERALREEVALLQKRIAAMEAGATEKKKAA